MEKKEGAKRKIKEGIMKRRNSGGNTAGRGEIYERERKREKERREMKKEMRK